MNNTTIINDSSDQFLHGIIHNFYNLFKNLENSNQQDI